MAQSYDVIVAGMGAMGSAASFHLTRGGSKVLGIDRFVPPHNAGSSHGQTRIIREAYFEHPSYVPLIQRAYTLWETLASESERQLLLYTGGLMIGRDGSTVISGALESAKAHELPHKLMTADDVRDRYPIFHPDDDMQAVWEPRAGVLFPEACVEAHLTLARQSGATLNSGETILRWKPEGSGVRVTTDKGEYLAGQLLITAGSWFKNLLPDLDLPFQVERQVQYWFEAKYPDLFAPEDCPIQIWEYEPGKFFYAFPDLGHGVKIALHHEGEITDADTVRRTIDATETETMRKLLLRYLPTADGTLLTATACVYTNSPDGHFLIDRHPAHSQVLIASPCSGHGFKFSSVIGEVLADLATKGESCQDLNLFRWRKWS
ncbi:MAG TPA: N-methyl-L-tryptophan oxidase [Roseimicrobium sp.]|nr:N-methyl-L-tryptophan oxidase [Roseimicrobium sp.]